MNITYPAGTGGVERLLLRPGTSEDESSIERVYASTREDLLLLPEAIRSNLMAMQFRAFVEDRGRSYPGLMTLLIVADDECIGYCSYAHEADAAMRIVDLALLPGFRGRGIGSMVLASVLGDADANKLRTVLHVEVRNPSRRLYERFGFIASETHGPMLRMERAPSPA